MSYGPPTALIYYFYGWFDNQEVAYIPGAKNVQPLVDKLLT